MERSDFAPGDYVRLPAQPGWGLGQVQSAVGPRVTVMFAHAGKVVVDTRGAALEPVEPDSLQSDQESPK